MTRPTDKPASGAAAHPAGRDATAKRRRSRRSLLTLGAWLAVGGLLAGGLVLAGGLHAASSPQRLAAGSTGRVAPRLAGTDPITGRHVSLAKFSGRPVVLNVWASWCPGCNQEARALARFAAAHPGVQLLGIDMNDTAGGARAFYRKWGWHYPSISDPDGTLAARLAVTGLPITLFLGAHHQILARTVGVSSLAALDRGLQILQGSRG